MDFMRHIYWHKKRLTVLRSKIKGLPDDHFWKPRCLLHLAALFLSVGNYVERDRLIAHVLKLTREQRSGVGAPLTSSSNTSSHKPPTPSPLTPSATTSFATTTIFSVRPFVRLSYSLCCPADFIIDPRPEPHPTIVSCFVSL